LARRSPPPPVPSIDPPPTPVPIDYSAIDAFIASLFADFPGGGSGSAPEQWFTPIVFATTTGAATFLLGTDSYFTFMVGVTAGFQQVSVGDRAIINAAAAVIADPGLLAWSNGSGLVMVPINRTVKAGNILYYRSSVSSSQAMLLRSMAV
jgi:hypothetical protein